MTGIVLAIVGIVVTILIGIFAARAISKRRAGRDSHEVSIRANGRAKVSDNVIAGRDVHQD